MEVSLWASFPAGAAMVVLGGRGGPKRRARRQRRIAVGKYSVSDCSGPGGAKSLSLVYPEDTLYR